MPPFLAIATAILTRQLLARRKPGASMTTRVRASPLARSRPAPLQARHPMRLPAPIIRALKEVDAGAKVDEVTRRLGVTQTTFYRWKSKFGAWRSRTRGASSGSRMKTGGSSRWSPT
jgi:putative transposase